MNVSGANDRKRARFGHADPWRGRRVRQPAPRTPAGDRNRRD